MKLMILDGNSIINRAFFGVRPLTTRDGLYTHAIFGFLNILQRLEKEEAPEALCVAFDLLREWTLGRWIEPGLLRLYDRLAPRLRDRAKRLLKL